MTKQEILDKMKMDLELRGRSADTIHDYLAHVRIYQDYFNKPADQMRETEIRTFLHYLLTEKKIQQPQSIRITQDSDFCMVKHLILF